MIDPNAPEIAKVDGQPSSLTTNQCPSPASRNGLLDDGPDRRSKGSQDDPTSITGTINPSIPERSREGSEASPDAALDGQQDVAQGWVETVIESLNERSPDERQALLKALLDGDLATHPIDPSTHPVSGTSFPKTPDFPRSSSRSGENCVTQPCHSVASNDLLTVWNRRRTSVSDCVTQV